MKRIDRYILVELLKTFAFSLGAITSLTMLLFLGQEGLKQGLTFHSIVCLIPFVLPSALYVAVPGTMLFAACLVYGRMSAMNEIIAIKSAGVSPLRIVLPAVLLAALFSLMTVWLNDVAVSWGRQGAYQVVLRSVEATIYSTLRTKGCFTNSLVSISVAGIENHKMIYPTVIVPGDSPDDTKTITAESAEICCFPERGVLAVNLVNGTATLGGENSFHFDTIAPEISLEEMTRKRSNLRRPSNCSLNELPVMVRQQSDSVKNLQRRMAVQATTGMLGGDFSMLGPVSWQSKARRIEDVQLRLTRLRTERWRRWSNGFSCLCFIMVGIPLAIRIKNADVWTSFGICFIPILLVYFPLLMLAVDRAKSGAWPPAVVMLGNAVLLVTGLVLLRRQWKH